MATDLAAPTPLIRAGLRLLPPPLLRLMLRRVNASLERRHPSLMRRLGRLAPARILFVPEDVVHAFLLTIVEGGATLGLADASVTADVTMRGTLTTLIDILESRIDSDTVFFSRALAVSGDTTIAVAFRNTLDGEDINLLADAFAELGPFAAPAERMARRVKRRVDGVAALGARVHRAAHGGFDPGEDRQRILAALDTLAARVGRLEKRSTRAKDAA